jgi:membrane protein DedA with SNARE-associated domain
MEDLIEKISLSSIWWAYGILILSAYVENVFPPIPGDTITLIGAYLVGTGKLNFFGVLISTTIGSVLGFMTLFLIAYWLEWRVIEKYQFKWIQKSHISRIQDWFRKYGALIILANRFLSGVRSVISLTAGLSRMNIATVFILAIISALIWNGLIISAGAFIGENWAVIPDYIKLYNKIIISIFGAGAIFYIIYYFLIRKKKAKQSDVQ